MVACVEVWRKEEDLRFLMQGLSSLDGGFFESWVGNSRLSSGGGAQGKWRLRHFRPYRHGPQKGLVSIISLSSCLLIAKSQTSPTHNIPY
jgi:hypothetical protein